MKIIGIDIGGTTIKADLYDDFGTSLNQFKEIETIIDYDLGTNQILNQVWDLMVLGFPLLELLMLIQEKSSMQAIQYQGISE